MHNEMCIYCVYSIIVECDRVFVSLAHVQCAVTTIAYVLLLKAQIGVFVRGEVLIYYTAVRVYYLMAGIIDGYIF